MAVRCPLGGLVHPDIDRPAWLAARHQAIGSSDAAAVCGKNPWRSALAVYDEKTRGAEDFPPSNQARWGLRLEPQVAAEYEDRARLKLFKVPLLVHPGMGWLRASIDRVTPDGDKIVELKTAGSRQEPYWGEPGSEDIPEYYLLQTQHQMLVSGIRHADVAVLIGGQDWRCYSISFRPELVESMVAIMARFWRRIVDRDPPEPDYGSPDMAEVVKRMNEPEGGDIALGVLEQEHLTAYVELGQKIRALEAEREQAQMRVIQAMGHCGRAIFPDGRIVTRRHVDCKGYTVDVDPYSYTNFSVRKS
jgi:putative phage-type endonuclease